MLTTSLLDQACERTRLSRSPCSVLGLAEQNTFPPLMTGKISCITYKTYDHLVLLPDMLRTISIYRCAIPWAKRLCWGWCRIPKLQHGVFICITTPRCCHLEGSATTDDDPLPTSLITPPSMTTYPRSSSVLVVCCFFGGWCETKIEKKKEKKEKEKEKGKIYPASIMLDPFHVHRSTIIRYMA